MKFNYKTKLVIINKKLIPFYEYNNNIGYIPAEIQFTFKNKLYTTSKIMTLIAELYYKNKNLSQIVSKFTINNWYNNEGEKFNKDLFIKFYSQCLKYRKI